jgi:hypothetical protein
VLLGFLVAEAIAYIFKRPTLPVIEDTRIAQAFAEHERSTERLVTANATGTVADDKLRQEIRKLKQSAERMLSNERRLEVPSRSLFQVSLHDIPAIIGDYVVVCAIVVKNVGGESLEQCIVQMDQYSGVHPPEMPFPLILRTDGQVRAALRGPFALSPGQATTIPILFKRKQLPNQWYFFDEAGERHFVHANPIKMVLGVYGRSKPDKFMLFVDVDAGWQPFPSISEVADDFSLPFGAGVRP